MRQSELVPVTVARLLGPDRAPPMRQPVCVVAVAPLETISWLPGLELPTLMAVALQTVLLPVTSRVLLLAETFTPRAMAEPLKVNDAPSEIVNWFFAPV